MTTRNLKHFNFWKMGFCDKLGGNFTVTESIRKKIKFEIKVENLTST